MTYSDDAPDINDSTSAEELISYTRKRIEDPIEIDGTTVYHFNSHEINFDALEDAVKNKLQRDVYQIPFQVHSGNTFIQSILPQRIKEAEILVYREDQESFYAYKNLIRDVPIESRDRIRQDLAEVTRDG